MRITLAGVEIPIDVDDFITPFMEQVLAFYPEWRKKSTAGWSIQGYLSAFCSALEKYEREAGREQKDRMERFVAHFGPHGVGELFSRYVGQSCKALKRIGFLQVRIEPEAYIAPSGASRKELVFKINVNGHEVHHRQSLNEQDDFESMFDVIFEAAKRGIKHEIEKLGAA